MKTTRKPRIYISKIRWDRTSVLALLPLIDCNGCGHCCVIPHPIRVQPQEVLRIAEYLGKAPDELNLEPFEDGATMDSPCQFRSKQGCSIWPVRPVVCKYFPLQKVDYVDDSVVAVLQEFCDAGRRCTQQLGRWH